MNKELSSKEKEEEEKAHAAVVRLTEEEKKKRKKKLQERAAILFLSYTKDVREKEDLARRSRDDRQKLQQEFYYQYIAEARKETEDTLRGLQEHDAHIGSFFDDCEKKEPAETVENRRALLENTGMSRSEFHAIALSSALENEECREDAVRVLCGKPCTSELRADALGKDALQSADKLLTAYRDGDTAKLQKLLTKNLRSGCREFAEAPDPVVALHWARHIGNLVSIMQHKELVPKNEKDAKLLENAAGIVAMGQVMESGYGAMLKMQKSCLEGQPLSGEEKALAGAQILLMQQIDDRRNSPAYQQLFAGNVKSEKRTPEENMKKVLEQLSKSSILQQLSSMSPEEQCFAFSDRESRKYLTREQFQVKKEQPQEALYLQLNPAMESLGI